jgi:hypothetical protein
MNEERFKTLADGRVAALMSLLGGRARITVGVGYACYDEGW